MVSEPRRHPATAAAWKWLEKGEGLGRSMAQREKIKSVLLELDRDLFALDEGWPRPANIAPGYWETAE